MICGNVLCVRVLALFSQSTAASEPQRSVDSAQNWNMPATILEVFEEDALYPNLYIGVHLLKNVSQDPTKRTTRA
jgi:hypothetical protein